MDKVTITVGDKSYKCIIADTEENRKQGLMGVKELPKDEGMLFKWDSEGTRQMWMKNTYIPLDLIAIDGNDEVIAIHKANPNDATLITFENAKYILEVNLNSKISIGDDLYIEDSNEKLPKMKILAPDGSTLMELDGGERIVSRRETKILIRKAKKAYNTKEDKDYKSLGKYIFKVFRKLDNRDPEYVEAPK